MGDVYTLCLRLAKFSKALGLRNLRYSKISVVMLLGYRIAGISRKLESYMSGAKNLKQYWNLVDHNLQILV